MRDSDQSLSALRERIAGDWSPGRKACEERFQSGHPDLDAYLDGGFLRGQLHEIFAGEADDNGSAAGFAAMLALRALEPGKPLLWLRTIDATRKGGRFSPAGMVELGGDPSALLMAVAPDDTALLRCAADALRCHGFGTVIVECWGAPQSLDLTASRRLTLSASHSGVTAIMLRPNAKEQPSTASTRWSVRAAPSTPLEANAPGHPALDLTLLRQRAGPSGRNWRLEWDRDERSFRKPAGRAQSASPSRRTTLPGAVVSLPAGKQARHSWGLKRSA